MHINTLYSSLFFVVWGKCVTLFRNGSVKAILWNTSFPLNLGIIETKTKIILICIGEDLKCQVFCLYYFQVNRFSGF